GVGDPSARAGLLCRTEVVYRKRCFQRGKRLMEAHSYRERGEAAVTTLKERLVNGETVCGAFVSNTRWPGYVEILAYHGYDCVFVETEHAPMNYDEIETIVRTARL